MRKFALVLALALSTTCFAATDFSGMLRAAEAGDAGARILIAHTYYFGEYRDGTKVEKDMNKAYAWASLANYQGHPEANKLVNGIIPQLLNRETADTMVGEYFKKFGAVKSSAAE